MRVALMAFDDDGEIIAIDNLYYTENADEQHMLIDGIVAGNMGDTLFNANYFEYEPDDYYMY